MLIVYLLYIANGTSTYAVRQDDHTYCLHGYKWFSSATDADMAFMLARIWDENKHITLVWYEVTPLHYPY